MSIQTQTELLKTVKERNVVLIDLWFVDILGQLKSFTISKAVLEKTLQEGISFDGSLFAGSARSKEEDMIAFPDIKTFCELPAPSDEGRHARMFADVVLPDGEAFTGNPRYVLADNLRRARKQGFDVLVGINFDYWYLGSRGNSQGVTSKQNVGSILLDQASKACHETSADLRSTGVPLDFLPQEIVPLQYRIGLKQADGVSTADALIVSRWIAMNAAYRHNVRVTFLPNTIRGHPGIGMHIRVYLLKNGRNVLSDLSGNHGISKECYGFIGGLLKHAPEIAIITNAWRDSYRQVGPGTERVADQGGVCQSLWPVIRVPTCSPASQLSTCVEYRILGSACNPYLVFSVILAAGLEGIAEGHEIPSEAIVQNGTLARREFGTESSITSLPAGPIEAIRIAKGSEFLKNTLGREAVDSLVANKKLEWEKSRTQVTPYEIETYLPVL